MKESRYVVLVPVAVAMGVGAFQGCGGTESAGAGRQAEPRNETSTGKTATCVGTRPVGSLPGRPDSTPLDRVLDHVREKIQPRHSDVFTGFSVDAESNAANVYRIASRALDDDICGAAEKGVTVRLHDSGINRRDLNALSARISADMHRWDGTFQLREVGADSAGYVYVGVDDPAKAEAALEEAFGADNMKHVRIEHVEQTHTLFG
ncbi:hypothetical protein J7E95_34705 [Streptomyces sp. ISL-14]|nr:hypothetical protein [Streptomyces sp. ISL-14]